MCYDVFMSQTHTQSAPKSTAPLGIQAAAAAASPATVPATVPANAVTTAVTGASDVTSPAGAPAEAPRTAQPSRKVFIVVGELHEFDTTTQAEKFLNGDAAPKTYAVIRGSRTGTSQKIHLR